MRTLSRVTAAILMSVVIMSVAGCGKVSAPAIYDNSGYPHSYPRN